MWCVAVGDEEKRERLLGWLGDVPGHNTRPVACHHHLGCVEGGGHEVDQRGHCRKALREEEVRDGREGERRGGGRRELF